MIGAKPWAGERVALADLFTEFLLVGVTAFGGFMALIAQAQKVVVGKRGWIGEATFADDVAIAAMLPGPIAVNLIAATGYRLRGAAGAAVAMIGVSLPAFLIICALAAAFGRLSQFEGATRAVIAGLLPVVAVIVLSAADAQARKAVTRPVEIAIAAASGFVLLVAHGTFVAPLLLITAGLLGIALYPDAPAPPVGRRPSPAWSDLLKLLLPLSLIVFYVAPGFLPQNLPARLSLSFAGMAPTLFGGGLIMIPLLKALVVTEMGWLSPEAFAAAISASQMTPGPILSSVIFAGFLVAGWPGAIAAGIGIFAPTAVMTIGAIGLADRLKTAVWLARFMRGVRVAVVGLILAAALALLAQVGLRPILLLLLPLAWLGVFRWKVAPYWLIGIAGLGALAIHATPFGAFVLRPVLPF